MRQGLIYLLFLVVHKISKRNWLYISCRSPSLLLCAQYGLSDGETL